MLGGWEWVIILAIVVILFGGGRISRIGGELGGAIANFRKGLRDGSKEIEDGKKDDTPIKPV
jgi:sec-independent protein translocase protein TatA